MSLIAFDDVTPELAGRTVPSRLYGSSIERLRVGRRIFVMTAHIDAEVEAHRHGHEGPVHARL